MFLSRRQTGARIRYPDAGPEQATHEAATGTKGRDYPMRTPSEIRVRLRSLLICAVASTVAHGLVAQDSMFRRGDANQDDSTDLSDGVFIITYLFLGGTAPDCLDAADITDNGVIDLTDAVNLMDFLFRGGPRPPAPGRLDCGVDPTPDDLDCRRYIGCDGDCTSNTDCPDDEYCAREVGGCGDTGACEFRPQACPRNIDPVCGCDGETYLNPCLARSSGVNIDHFGECEARRCGTIAGIPCDESELCDFPPGTCNVADNTGVCVAVGGVCVAIFDPVCGCDGQTYGNDCQRILAGAQKDHDGPCDRICDGFAGFPCEEGEFCEHEPDTCNIADDLGICVPVPEACPLVFDPVCGCDGETYGNDCQRRAAQVQLAHMGPCER